MAASQQPVIDFASLPLVFFARPAQIVGPELVGCRLVQRQGDPINRDLLKEDPHAEDQ